MITRYQKTVDPDGPGNEEKTAEGKAVAGSDSDACRCKQASEMTPRELLKLMFSDLAFWKKTNRV